MKVICGLGNPGSAYEDHRHNVGFQVVERLCARAKASLTQMKFEGKVAQGNLAGERVLFIEPQTFMNLSGQSVVSAMRFYKVATEALLVIHDELDLPFGRLQLKSGGGTGGHNGLRSIVEQLGEDAFPRLRFGIGKPEGVNAKERVLGHVLSGFGTEERETLEALVDRAADAVEFWAREGLAVAMNRFNRSR